MLKLFKAVKMSETAYQLYENDAGDKSCRITGGEIKKSFSKILMASVEDFGVPRGPNVRFSSELTFGVDFVEECPAS